MKYDHILSITSKTQISNSPSTILITNKSFFLLIDGIRLLIKISKQRTKIKSLIVNALKNNLVLESC